MSHFQKQAICCLSIANASLQVAGVITKAVRGKFTPNDWQLNNNTRITFMELRSLLETHAFLFKYGSGIADVKNRFEWMYESKNGLTNEYLNRMFTELFNLIDDFNIAQADLHAQGLLMEDCTINLKSLFGTNDATKLHNKLLTPKDLSVMSYCVRKEIMLRLEKDSYKNLSIWE